MRSLRLLGLLLLAASSAALGLDTRHAVEPLGHTTYPRRWDNRVAIPYLDADNRLHWNDRPVLEAGACSGAWFPQAGPWEPHCQRRTIILGPRVDQCHCTGETPAGVRTGIAYAGIDGQDRERWRRESHSPAQREAPHLVGAHADGLVFSSLEVWSPLTGKTVRAALATSPSFASTCYLPERDMFLESRAEVTLFRARGGLYLRSSGGQRELILPVDAKLTGYYRIEAMAPLPGTSLVLIAEAFSTRGPGSARLEILDLDSRRVIFRDEQAAGHYVADLRVAVGTGGHIVFSYLDETAGQHAVTHYRVR